MDALRFDGQVAIVTGAGSNPGLGRAYALLLAERGARVVVNEIGSADPADAISTRAEAVAEEIVGRGGDAIADGHSVAEPDSARAVVQTALEAWGRVDILINNAGVCYMAGFDEISEGDTRRTIDVHLMGSIWMSRAVWPEMRRHGYGRIVNTTSGAMLGEPNLTVYGAAKAGIFGLTRGLALEGAPLGIRVNAVGPSAATQAAFDASEYPPEMRKGFADLYRPERVAPAVCLLAHARCELSGAVIDAGAGEMSSTLFGRTTGLHDLDATVEDVAENVSTITDPATFAITTDPTNPRAGMRDADGVITPVPYRPTTTP
jgi:NAD(P)-dependent dehydrogenase (short-subunit alcohol dehydrogenase family)